MYVLIQIGLAGISFVAFTETFERAEQMQKDQKAADIKMGLRYAYMICEIKKSWPRE